MTAPLIAPLIPSRARPGGRSTAGSGTIRRLPVAAMPEVPNRRRQSPGLGRPDWNGYVVAPSSRTRPHGLP
jgi:hypothetical protein